MLLSVTDVTVSLYDIARRASYRCYCQLPMLLSVTDVTVSLYDIARRASY